MCTSHLVREIPTDITGRNKEKELRKVNSLRVYIHSLKKGWHSFSELHLSGSL